MERLRWPYRVREFIDLMRSYQIAVGYRFGEPRPSMEMSAIDFVAPDFAKMLAPISAREELWQEMSREVNSLGLTRETFVLAGIEREEQLKLARKPDSCSARAGLSRSRTSRPGCSARRSRSGLPTGSACRRA